MGSIIKNLCKEIREVNAGLFAVHRALSDTAERDSGGNFSDYTVQGQLFLLERLYERFDEIIRSHERAEEILASDQHARCCHATCHDEKVNKNGQL